MMVFLIMEGKDYYKILGITKNASANEIKKAYRKLAMKYHPDKNMGDKTSEQKFHRINEAHEVLSDPEKRKKYDAFGQDWKHYKEAGSGDGGFEGAKYRGGQARGGHENAFHFSDGSGQNIPNDFFEKLFGQSFARAGGSRDPVKGADTAAEAPITLEEAFHGTSRILQVNGKKIKVTIKPGTADNQQLRLSGKGLPGLPGESAGDLYIKIKLLPHSIFKRTKDDLSCDIPVDLYTAVLGGSVIVKTLKGTVALKVPPESENGQVFKMTGLGMPIFLSKNNDHGDLYARINVQLPKKLSEAERELFKKLQETTKEEVH